MVKPDFHEQCVGSSHEEGSPKAGPSGVESKRRKQQIPVIKDPIMPSVTVSLSLLFFRLLETG